MTNTNANGDETADPAHTAQPDRISRCPACGADATAESLRQHDLGALGYLHDDQRFECRECGEHYTHGVPVGAFDRPDDAADLWCDVCDLGYMAVHRVNPSDDAVRLHLKCPHHHPFDCPDCDTRIRADGLRPIPPGTGTGARTGIPDRDSDRDPADDAPGYTHACPHCEVPVARDAVPFCYYFDDTARALGDRGQIALVGYPAITGRTVSADAYGYPSDDDAETLTVDEVADDLGITLDETEGEGDVDADSNPSDDD